MTAASERNADLEDERADDRQPLRYRPRGRVLQAEEVQRYETATALMQAAEREAEDLRADAMSVLERARRQGFEQGRQEGAKAIARLLSETTLRADRYLEEADTEIVDLALAVVRQVLGEFDVEKLTRDAVMHGLAKQRQDQHLTLYVTPDMAEPMRADLDQRIAPAKRHLITVELDPKLDHGQCRLASEIGFIDLGVRAQLEAIQQGLRDGLNHHARD